MNSMTPRRRGTRVRMLAVTLAILGGVTAAQAANCDMTLSEAAIDYGHLKRAELEASHPPPHDVSLSPRRLTLNIRCEQPAPITLRFHAPPAAKGGYAFADGGSFTLHLSQATLDGRAVELATTDDSGHVIQRIGTSQYLEADQGVAILAGGERLKGTHAVISVEVDPSVPHTALRVREETQWKGGGQFELIAR